jgi:hypothetical protein
VAAAAAAPTGHLIRQLVVIDGADKGRTFRLPQTGIVPVGKSNKHADVVLHDLYVSRVHCELSVQGDRVLVTHLEGDGGTLVNGQRIAGPQELHPGEVLRVGNSHLRLDVVAEAAAKAAAAAEEEAEEIEVVEDEVEVVEDGEEVEVVEEAEGGGHLPHAAIDRLMELEDQVLGHYKIGPLLGRGQFGLVFRAEDVKTGQVVAMKVLSPDFPASGAELQRFAQALKAAPHLNHPHLVTLIGAGKTGHHCWIAREYVEGESVPRLVQRRNDRGYLDWTAAARVAVHLGRALGFLHQHKVAHRNITPRNVLVRGGDKMTKLADLMLTEALAGSKLHKAVGEKKRLAELPYLAPEQTEPGAFVDHLADLYALGAVVYTLLTAQPPFAGDSPAETLARIREGKLVKPSKYQRGLPGPFEAVVLKLLARHQEDRYQTAAELLADLEPIVKEHQIKV